MCEPLFRELVDYTDGCHDCAVVQSRYKELKSDKFGFTIHIERSSLTEKKKKREKKNILHRTEKLVSALRNTGGGVLLVHLNGQVKGDQCLEFFDEFINNSLSRLSDHGKLYVDVYKRSWLHDSSNITNYHDFVEVGVTEADVVAIVDFNSKIRNDHEIISPLICNIRAILSRQLPAQNNAHISKSWSFEDICHKKLQENRNLEFKRLNESLNDLTGLVNHIWEDLKLKHILTAFTKVQEGGSYLVGISECSSAHGPDYRTKKYDVVGFELRFDESDFLKELTEKIRSSVTLFDRDNGFSAPPDDLVKIQLHPIPGKQRYVLHVYVRYFNGVVFSETGGPRAYTVHGGKIVRFTREEWVNILLRIAE